MCSKVGVLHQVVCASTRCVCSMVRALQGVSVTRCICSKTCVLQGVCAPRRVRSKAGALQGVCAPRRVCSKARALQGVCAQRRVCSKARALQGLDLFSAGNKLWFWSFDYFFKWIPKQCYQIQKWDALWLWSATCCDHTNWNCRGHWRPMFRF
jgi:hypothetical protein